MAHVLKLFRAPKRRAPMEELAEAPVTSNSGLEGCAHARPNGKRQVLLVDRETLDAMNLQAGIVRENSTTDGLAVNDLKVGQQLRVGSTQLEVSAVCEPREELEKVRSGLQQAMEGRRGMLCLVIAGGTVRSGDTIEIIS